MDKERQFLDPVDLEFDEPPEGQEQEPLPVNPRIESLHRDFRVVESNIVKFKKRIDKFEGDGGRQVGEVIRDLLSIKGIVEKDPSSLSEDEWQKFREISTKIGIGFYRFEKEYDDICKWADLLARQDTGIGSQLEALRGFELESEFAELEKMVNEQHNKHFQPAFEQGAGVLEKNGQFLQEIRAASEMFRSFVANARLLLDALPQRLDGLRARAAAESDKESADIELLDLQKKLDKILLKYTSTLRLVLLKLTRRIKEDDEMTKRDESRFKQLEAAKAEKTKASREIEREFRSLKQLQRQLEYVVGASKEGAKRKMKHDQPTLYDNYIDFVESFAKEAV
ncbi:MAG: hypothetical protein HYT15_00540 [Candidatus Magasanikbacteria bacterium]|nr:hypothetical protein [Candidatus Magasanikbacteria bacterium]